MFLEGILQDPELQSSVFPFVITFVLLLGLNFLPFSKGKTQVAVFSIGLGIILTLLLIAGLPPFPPKSSGQKIFYLLSFSVFVGLALDSIKLKDIYKQITVYAVVTISSFVVVSNIFSGKDILAELLVFLLISFVFLVVLWRLTREYREHLTVPIIQFSTLMALGFIALLSSTASVAQTAIAMGACMGAYMLLNYPKKRIEFSYGALLVTSQMGLMLISQMAFFTRTDTRSLLLLPLILLPTFFDKKIGTVMEASSFGPFVRPVLIGIVCAIPAAGAIALSYSPQPTGY